MKDKEIGSYFNFKSYEVRLEIQNEPGEIWNSAYKKYCV